MIDLYDELHRVVRALDDADVAYAIVGGFAVSMLARARATDDIDLLIAATQLDAAKAALEAIGYEARLAPFAVARGRLRIQRFLRTEREDVVLVDALLAAELEELAMLERRLSLDSEGGRLRVVTRDDLRALKRLRGNPQDLADLAALDDAEDES
jgi:predicted nucleotidyltransferase